MDCSDDEMLFEFDGVQFVVSKSNPVLAFEQMSAVMGKERTQEWLKAVHERLQLVCAVNDAFDGELAAAIDEI